MTDTVLRGTGNSRTLRTVANAKTLYPTWDSALTALINGTFPIDIGSLNSAGLSRRGTDLNKANILTDATATGMGLTSSATPNDAFARLKALIEAVKEDKSNCQLYTTSYVGTGVFGPNNQNSLTFPHKPFLVFLISGSDSIPLVRGANSVHGIGTSYVNFSYSGNTVQWNGSSAVNQLNSPGASYPVSAFLEM